MHNAVVHAGDWELRVRAGPMLRSAETRSLCASWFAPRRPWCVAGPGPPADCPCGALDLCGVAAHVPEAVHGRSFVEAVHAPTGARVAIDALHALRGWGNGRIVPRGPLREEPRALLSRADVVALHHFPRFVSNETETDERKSAQKRSAEALERDVRALLDPDRNPLVIKTKIRPTRIERLARYVGECPPHEWTPPLSRLRGARVFCPCGVGDATSVRESLEALTAPALDDPRNGYGLRVRRTGSVEVWDLGDHEPFWSCDATLAKITNRFREMHRTSGDVGSAEARMVLTEKDVARVIASEPEKRFKALAALAQCDPLVLCAELVVPDEAERRALNARLRETLRR